VFAVDASTWDVVVGDVCGKGAEAATTTALARYTLRAAAIHSDTPSAVLRVLDEVLRRDPGDTPFLTAVYVRLRREGDGFSGTVCCAGHPRPVLVAANGDVRAVGEPGSLLGVLSDPDLVDVRLRLDAGDTLVLYTDGVIEARSARGVPFGDDRLLALLAATYDRPLAQIPRLVEAAADDPGRQEPDDLAVLAVRVEAAADHAGRGGAGPVEWIELPCDPGSTAQARRFAAAIVTRGGAGGALRTVELVVSELVANGVRHAHTPVTLGVSADHDGVRLEVLDTGAGGARVVKPSQDAVSGRGLGLVATVATRWGVEQRVPRGTRVWCELSAHADAHWAHRV
jgi:anti-sigma regulatory factor (Ser/Thr protein kinase)